ncbi:LOW QUALITY PROTEIN: hereditary hemochromatosis protein homolog isoform X2 [Cricetulus griseus]|uniref:LOW QUALITY PROTEIN: hereditary hemochromatosis protein homolog isoform X2 n=1 Tax=Cricetulus griseus TaxID=10029 RepID=A0A9J7HH08_CRIGR|nr:LOW QUALITY PROTEIN: hereditary hemochromatosis protein homolog isoform X2 [Cricetulus griseus]
MLFISTYETLRQRIAWFRSLKAELTVGTHELISTGPHTLRFDLMTTSLDVPDKILALGYFDDKPFLRYKGDNRTAEALTPGLRGHAGAETQARETEGLWKKQLRAMVAEVARQIDQDRGNHTIQVTFGCELHRNGSTRGFWRLGYDGQDSITFDQKTLTWTMAVPSTQQTRNFREIYAPKAAQVFLKDTCPAQLQECLDSSKNILLNTGAPKVKVTSRRYPVGRITLTCWAFNLYPPVATLVWLQGGKPVQQQNFGPGTILPSGDGTYQTWVSIWVLPGQEPEFTCCLRNCSKNIVDPVFLGEKMGQPFTSGVGGKVRESLWSTITKVFLLASRTSRQEH